MDGTFFLATTLLAFAAGWLAAMHAKDRAYYEMMRRDMRIISGLRLDLSAKDLALREQKKRYALVLGTLRKTRREKTEARFGPGVFRDPTLLAAHKQIEAARKLIDRLNEKYGLLQPLGHLPPLAKAMCWKCGKPATTRLGDSMYCDDCHKTGERAVP